MKTYYVTGSTAGLYPEELMQKFENIVEELAQFHPKEITSVNLIEVDQTLNRPQKIDARLKAVSEAQCILFTDDWQESLESTLEFREAVRLKKEIRFYNTSDMKDIERCLAGVVPGLHG